jgi:hypothetical protein
MHEACADLYPPISQQGMARLSPASFRRKSQSTALQRNILATTN